MPFATTFVWAPSLPTPRRSLVGELCVDQLVNPIPIVFHLFTPNMAEPHTGSEGEGGARNTCGAGSGRSLSHERVYRTQPPINILARLAKLQLSSAA